MKNDDVLQVVLSHLQAKDIEQSKSYGHIRAWVHGHVKVTAYDESKEGNDVPNDRIDLIVDTDKDLVYIPGFCFPHDRDLPVTIVELDGLHLFPKQLREAFPEGADTITLARNEALRILKCVLDAFLDYKLEEPHTD